MDADFRADAAEVCARRFAVLVGHPERAMEGGATAHAVLDDELAAGSAVQLSAWSLTGRYGERTRDPALRILRAAPIAIVPPTGMEARACRRSGRRSKQ